MGVQKNTGIPSRMSGKTTTTTMSVNVPTSTLSNDVVQDKIANYLKHKEAFASKSQIVEHVLTNRVEKEQEERKNSITFFKTPSNEDFEKLMECYKNLPHKLKNIEVSNMRSSYKIDLDDEDFEEMVLDDDFEGVAIEAERDGTVQHFFSLPMQEDFVKAINTNTANLKEKYNTLRSRYVETNDDGKETIIKPFDEEYYTEYDNLVAEEHDFLFGDASIINTFNESKQNVINMLVVANTKDKELKNEFKKLKKNLKIEVKFSDPIRVVTGIDRDINGVITEIHEKSINTKLTLTLKYPKSSDGTPKELFSKTFDLLDN